jgi:hypothetical protein
MLSVFSIAFVSYAIGAGEEVFGSLCVAAEVQSLGEDAVHGTGLDAGGRARAACCRRRWASV